MGRKFFVVVVRVSDGVFLSVARSLIISGVGIIVSGGGAIFVIERVERLP